MVCGPCVPPIFPSRLTLCPASPSLKWVPRAAVPHPIGPNYHCSDHRYYDLLRLPDARHGFVRSSLSTPDTLYRPSLALCLPHFVRDSFEGGTFPPNARILPYGWFSLYLLFTRKHLDLPSSRATPFEYMPWSQTPVVSRLLALTHSGLLPSAACRASAFFPIRGNYPQDHNYTFFGAQYRACTLGFGLPSPGLPVDFTTDLPARL
jgi:hypothetical protein